LKVKPSVAENIHLIKSNDPLNSYCLAELSNVCSTYTSQIGAEISAMGKPLVIAGDAFYGKQGIGLMPKTQKEYFDAIMSNWTHQEVSKENALVMIDTEYTSEKPNILPTKLSGRTNSNGYVSFNLVKGVNASLMVAGTDLCRKIRVPSDVDSFDLTSQTIGVSTDEYSVRVPNIQVGVRRSI
jgi:hypothetical protein